ncbi:MAG: isochorismate synthase [Bacteroidetes bacterium]|nr:MAG: isochorismate synthase [Bacteroidota bacterium]
MHSDWKNRFSEAQSKGHAVVYWFLPDAEEPGFCESEQAFVWDFQSTGSTEFVFAPFDLQQYPALVIGRKEGAEAKFQLTAPQLASAEQYQAVVANMVAAIQAKQFQKLVGARAEGMPSLRDAFAHFDALCIKHPNAFRYILYSPQTGLWMGASPELLLKKEGQQIQTVALAGTQKASQEAWSDKEMEEQEFVVSYIKTVLGPLSDRLEISEKETWHSGHLLHLINRYTAQIKAGTSLETVVKALHPTPAVAGLPKQEAIEFIRSAEGFDRSYYSGFVGPVKGEQASFYVNLRCLQILEKAFRYAGAGLTAHSDPEKEWLETAEKMKVVSSLS